MSTGVAYMYLTDPERLRKWIIDREFSYADLGNAVGVSRQFIWQLAHGKKRTCSPAVARKIEKYVLPPISKRSPDEKPLFVKRRTDVVKPAPAQKIRAVSPNLLERPLESVGGAR